MLWFSILFITWNLCSVVTSEESCYQYRRKANVTIDTDQCLWQNYTEPKPKRFSLDSCFENYTCIGVAIIDGDMTQQCCLLFDNEIRISQPGDQILYHHKEATIQCKRGWSGNNCDSCDTNFEPPGQCNVCVNHWAGLACDGCATGWSGTNCDVCDTNFGPPGSCDSCLTGFAGDNCSECDRGWTGSECDVCNTNFGPPGNCSRCRTRWVGENCDACAQGWTGDNCQFCEGFGFSEDSNCTECIQNGLWVGRQRSNDVEVHFTFTGSSCSELVTGTPMKVGRIDTTLASGSLDEESKILNFRTENWDYFFTNIADDKGLSHTANQVSLTYRGMS